MSDELARLYANRFDQSDRAWKDAIWEILWRRVFSAWVRPEDTVVDLGAGYCEFINHARAARRIAVDLNPETRALAAPGVEVHASSADRLSFLGDASVDVVFTSNFLEHLPSKEVIGRVFEEAKRVLKPGGRFILMGPNVRYVPGEYWDYFDHHIPLTHASVGEGLLLHGFTLERVEAKFLPYTVKASKLRLRWLVDLYLRLRPLSSAMLGKQFLVVARR